MSRSRTLLFTVVLTACHRAASPAPSAAAAPVPAPAAAARVAAADVRFMSGMIPHHAQAVLMGGWSGDSIHEAGRAVRTLSARIVVSQTDEIGLMERWLRERGQPVPPADPHGHRMPGMAHPMLMPGMLTPAQLAQLDSARGSAFDRLFLTFMIQHHQGALTMVDALLGAPGAAQDGLVFRFAADVHADQTTEIERMRRMLAALPSGGSR